LQVEHYKWALATSWARTFLVAMPPFGECQPRTEEQENKPGSNDEQEIKHEVTAFIPFADLLNYSAQEPCGGEMDSNYQYFRVWTSHPISPGEQIFIEYGNKGNAELLLYYGFAIQDNPNSSLKLAFYLAKSDPLIIQKEKLLKDLHMSPYHVDDDYLWYEIPVMMGELNLNEETERITTINPLLMPFLRISAITNEVELTCPTFSEPISLANEIAALHTLGEKCQSQVDGYPTTIEEDEEILSERPPSNPRILFAVIARLEEKRIYTDITEKVKVLIDFLLAQNSLT